MPDLEFMSPDNAKPLPLVPPNVPERLEDAERYLTEMFWIGDALGYDGRAPEAIVSSSLQWYYGFKAGVFGEQDLPIVHDFIVKVVKALDEGLDDKGRKRGPIGAEIAAFEHFYEDDSDGVLMTRNTHRLVRTIDFRLWDIRVMFEFAMNNGLWVHWT